MKNIRLPLKFFAIEMEKQLRENDKKSNWINFSIGFLYGKLRTKLKEFDEVYQSGIDDIDYYSKLQEKAIDLANYAMMIYDNASRELIKRID